MLRFISNHGDKDNLINRQLYLVNRSNDISILGNYLLVIMSHYQINLLGIIMC